MISSKYLKSKKMMKEKVAKGLKTENPRILFPIKGK